MKLSLLKSILATVALAAPTLASFPAWAQTTAFFCGNAGGTPATMGIQQGQNVPVILWVAENYFNESGEDAITRCTRVSSILNSYRQQGNLNQVITTGTSRNGSSMICAANPQGGDCRLLYQVPRGQNPEQARQELLKRLKNPSFGVAPISIN